MKIELWESQKGETEAEGAWSQVPKGIYFLDW